MNCKYIICLIFVNMFWHGYGGAQSKQVTLSNKLKVERHDELIILKRDFLEQKTGTIPSGRYVQIYSKNSTPVVVQYDDLNNDGQWDEAVFLYSFKAGEVVSFKLQIDDGPATVKAVVRAHARHKRKNANDTFGPDLMIDSIPTGQSGADFTKVKLPPFLTEGPAWENDKVGFRIYFDVRNGKDVWGKTTPAMVLDDVGVNPDLNYHEQAEWGMDLLKVGSSLGAGSLALQVPIKGGKDTLVRLGNKNMGRAIYSKIADGPIRAIIRLQYPVWKVLNHLPPVLITEEISIWGGQYFYESKVTLGDIPDGAKLVTGIVNLKSKQYEKLSGNGFKISYTFDQQSENHDELGMGIMVADHDFDSYLTTPNADTDITNTYAVRMNLKAGKPVSFRFYAGWSKSNQQFIDQNSFAAYLKDQGKRSSFPILIK